jgi:hypothetical protein
MRRHERAGLLAAIRVTRCLLPRTVEPAVCASEANTPSIFAVAAHLEGSGILEVHREQRGPKQDEADGAGDDVLHSLVGLLVGELDDRLTVAADLGVERQAVLLVVEGLHLAICVGGLPVQPSLPAYCETGRPVLRRTWGLLVSSRMAHLSEASGTPAGLAILESKFGGFTSDTGCENLLDGGEHLLRPDMNQAGEVLAAFVGFHDTAAIARYVACHDEPVALLTPFLPVDLPHMHADHLGAARGSKMLRAAVVAHHHGTVRYKSVELDKR